MPLDTRPSTPGISRHTPATIALLILVLLAFIIPEAIDRWAEREAIHSTADTRHSVNLADCTPPDVHLTPLVDIHVRQYGSGRVVIGCTRHERRPIPTERVVRR